MNVRVRRRNIGATHLHFFCICVLTHGDELSGVYPHITLSLIF